MREIIVHGDAAYLGQHFHAALDTAELVQRETGGNLAEILERISAVVRGRFKLQRKEVMARVERVQIE